MVASKIFTGIAVCSFTILLGSTLASRAETMNVKASLSGAQETPPTTTKGTGTLTGTYDSATKKLTWSVSYSGLSGPATAAHFHGPAAAGKAAPVEVPAPGADKNPIAGSATLTDAQAKDLTAGNMYFNVHTAANKGGEIRGQVTASK